MRARLATNVDMLPVARVSAGSESSHFTGLSDGGGAGLQVSDESLLPLPQVDVERFNKASPVTNYLF
jgi:hypothetical protein